MGARVYLPTLGRFLQIDPIEGGTANDYVYALDPVNSSDYSGKSLSSIFATVGPVFFPGLFRKKQSTGETYSKAGSGSTTCFLSYCNISNTKLSTFDKILLTIFVPTGSGTSAASMAGRFLQAAIAPTSVACGTGKCDSAGRSVQTWSINVQNYTYSGNALKVDASRPYQASKLLVQEIVSTPPNAIPYKDHLLSWSVEGRMRGAQGVYELTIDPAAEQITHFLFKKN